MRSSACDALARLRPVRALLVRIPLGPRPSLHRLRCFRLRSGLALFRRPRAARSGEPPRETSIWERIWRCRSVRSGGKSRA